MFTFIPVSLKGFSTQRLKRDWLVCSKTDTRWDGVKWNCFKMCELIGSNGIDIYALFYVISAFFSRSLLTLCRLHFLLTKWGLLKENWDQKSSSLKWRTSWPHCSSLCRFITLEPDSYIYLFYYLISCFYMSVLLVCFPGFYSNWSWFLQKTSHGNVELLMW